MDILSYLMGYESGKSAAGGDAPTILENLPLGLDFTNGDQLIVAPDGKLVKSAIIQKPDGLKPENIAEGVNIAGIDGALSAGGGTLVAKFMRFTATANTQTVTHNMGATPIFAMAYPTTGYITVQDANIIFAAGVSSEIGALMGTAVDLQYGVYHSSYRGEDVQTSPDYPIDTSKGVGVLFSGATDSVIKIGTSSYGMQSGYEYTLLLVGYKTE